MSEPTLIVPMSRREAMRTAQRMREGSWTVPQIRDYLAARGWDRNRETIRRWSDPSLDERSRQESAQRNRDKRAARGARLTRAFQTYGPEFKLARVMALRGAGLSPGAIARVMNLDFGDDLTASKVRWAQEIGRYPKDARSPQSAKEESAVGAGTTPETCLRTATIRGPKESAGAVGAAPRMAPKESSSADAE